MGDGTTEVFAGTLIMNPPLIHLGEKLGSDEMTVGSVITLVCSELLAHKTHLTRQHTANGRFLGSWRSKTEPGLSCAIHSGQRGQSHPGRSVTSASAEVRFLRKEVGTVCPNRRVMFHQDPTKPQQSQV